MGYTMTTTHMDGQDVVEAMSERTGERFVARTRDTYTAACEVAAMVGIELEDG